MAPISSRNLVDVVLRVERMTFQDREQLAEEVHTRQPNLFFSVLVVRRYGATLEHMESALQNASDPHERLLCGVQERCLTRISGRVRFIEGLTPQQQAQATADAVGGHPEPHLLAYIFGKFKENGLLGIKTEAEKMLMLAALNLIECIADKAPQMTRWTRWHGEPCVGGEAMRAPPGIDMTGLLPMARAVGQRVRR